MTRMKLDFDEQAFVLARRIGHLATVDSAGEPFVVPVCYAWDGDRFYTPIDEKPKRGSRPLKRVRNIEETAIASLVIDHYDDQDWSRLGWVLVRGAAAIIAPGNAEHSAALSLLRERYPQYRQMALESRPVIAVTPRLVTSWGLIAE